MKADNYRFIYGLPWKIAGCFAYASMEDEKDGERKGRLASTGQYLMSRIHGRLDCFEEVRCVEGFV